jgi:hypothetical protein
MLFSDLLPIASALPGATPTKGGLAVTPPIEEYLPTWVSLRDNFGAGQDPGAMIADYLAIILPRYELVASNTRLLDLLRGLAQAETDIQSEAAAFRKKGFQALRDYDFRLEAARIDGTTPGANGAVAVRDLVELGTNPAQSPIADVIGTPENAKLALLALRQLDDLCIRLLAVDRAARDLGEPFADVLTLYRQECGLWVYPPTDAFLKKIPTAAPEELNQGTSRPGERTAVDPRWCPSYEHGYWLADKAAPDLMLQGGAAAFNDDQLRTTALSTFFFLNTLGFDNFSFTSADAIVNNDFAAIRAEFIARGKEYWAASGLPAAQGSEQALGLRWDGLIANLNVIGDYRGLDGQQPAAVLVAPIDPVLHLAEMLKEGMAFLYSKVPARRLLYRPGQEQSVPGADLPLHIAYGRYNLQYQDSQDFRQMLASALRHAARYTRLHHGAPLAEDPFADLFNSIKNSDPLKEFIVAVNAIDASEPHKPHRHSQAALDQYDQLMIAWNSNMQAGVDNKPADNPAFWFDARFESWLFDQVHRELLFDFVLNASFAKPARWTRWHNDALRLGKLTASAREHIINFYLTRKCFSNAFGTYPQ